MVGRQYWVSPVALIRCLGTLSESLLLKKWFWGVRCSLRYNYSVDHWTLKRLAGWPMTGKLTNMGILPPRCGFHFACVESTKKLWGRSGTVFRWSWCSPIDWRHWVIFVRSWNLRRLWKGSRTWLLDSAGIPDGVNNGGQDKKKKKKKESSSSSSSSSEDDSPSDLGWLLMKLNPAKGCSRVNSIYSIQWVCKRSFETEPYNCSQMCWYHPYLRNLGNSQIWLPMTPPTLSHPVGWESHPVGFVSSGHIRPQTKPHRGPHWIPTIWPRHFEKNASDNYCYPVPIDVVGFKEMRCLSMKGFWSAQRVNKQ